MNTQNFISVLEKTGTGFTKLHPAVQLSIVFGTITFFAVGAVVLPFVFGTAMILIAWLSIIAIILQINKNRSQDHDHDTL